MSTTTDHLANRHMQEFTEGNIVFYAPRKLAISNQPNYHPIREVVFYNPRMVMNRDATMAYLKILNSQKKLTGWIIDPFAGCGIRSLRIAKQVSPGLNILANDINPVAVQTIRYNVNKLKLEKEIQVTHNNAIVSFSKAIDNHDKVRYIDIDPFGSPMPFLDPAITCLDKKEGYIGVTATDMPVLCGIYPEAALRKYASLPIKTEYVHEVALRILIYALFLSIGRQGRHLEIQFTYSSDHYLRFFGKVLSSSTPNTVSLSDIGYIYHCPKCKWRRWEPISKKMNSNNTCLNCASLMWIGGPLYLGSLFNEHWLTDLLEILPSIDLDNEARLTKIIQTQLLEIGGPPMFFNTHKLAIFRKADQIPINDIVSIIQEAGYFASRTHFSPVGIRTSANINDLSNIFGKE